MRLFAIFVICLASLYAQDAPDLATLLKQSTDSLKKHKSYQMSMEVTTDMIIASQPVKMVLSSDVSAINPDKIRIESKESLGGGATIVSTGEFLYMYLPALRQYTETAGVANVRQMLNSTGMTNLPDEGTVARNARLIRQESMQADGAEHPCWVVETKIDVLPLPTPAGGSITDSVLTMWIDKKNFLVWRSTMVGRMQAGPISSDMRQETRLRSIQLDPTLPDSLFTFVPPDGAKEVANFGGPGMDK